MAVVKITITVECENDAEYAVALSRLESHNPTDGRFATQSLTGNESTKVIQLVHEPTTQII